MLHVFQAKLPLLSIISRRRSVTTLNRRESRARILSTTQASAPATSRYGHLPIWALFILLQSLNPQKVNSHIARNSQICVTQPISTFSTDGRRRRRRGRPTTNLALITRQLQNERCLTTVIASSYCTRLVLHRKLNCNCALREMLNGPFFVDCTLCGAVSNTAGAYGNYCILTKLNSLVRDLYFH